MSRGSVIGRWMVRRSLLLIIAGALPMTWGSTAAALPAGVVAPQGTIPAASAWPSRIQPAVDTTPPWATVAAPLAIRGVTMVDVERGRHLADQTVVVVGNRIRRMGPTAKVKLPRGAQVVDGRGKYLIPGLWDMHVHPCDLVDIAFPLYLAYGVTGVRDPGSGVPLAVLGQLKREIAAGTRLGPRMVVAGPLVHGYRGGPDSVDITDNPGNGCLFTVVWTSTPQKVRRVVDSLQAAGADFIKTYFLTPEMYFAVVAEARRIGIPFGGHGVYDWASGQWDPDVTGVSGLALSDSGAQILDHQAWLRGDPCGERHPDSLNVAACAAAGQHFRRNGTWIVETPQFFPVFEMFPAVWYDNLRYAPRFKYDSSALMRLRDSLKQVPGFTHPAPQLTADWIAGAHFVDSLRPLQGRRLGWEEQMLRHSDALVQLPVLAGTDNGAHISPRLPGQSLHNVLVSFVLGGMSPLAALQTATLNPARALHATDSLGTVQAGKVADLVLLDADPLADIWNTTKIRAVVANGRYYDQPALERLRAQAERAAAER